MIFDVHSNAHRADSFTQRHLDQATRILRGTKINLVSRLEDYRRSCRDSFRRGKDNRFRREGQVVRNLDFGRYVAEYCSQDLDHLIAFMSLDPTQEGWRHELEEGHQTLKMKGIKLLPIYAGFYPQARELDDLWAYASRHGLPVLLHTGTTYVDQAPLDCTLPRHLDQVAIKYPDCHIILAHLGHPYEGETVAVIRKHPNVYADVSALYYRPFQLYHSLMLIQEYGVWDKLLFGTDYPVTSVDDTIRGLRGLNEMLDGTSLPRLNADEIESVIHRDAGSLLGLQ